jgi:hypothetical protein
VRVLEASSPGNRPALSLGAASSGCTSACPIGRRFCHRPRGSRLPAIVKRRQPPRTSRLRAGSTCLGVLASPAHRQATSLPKWPTIVELKLSSQGLSIVVSNHSPFEPTESDVRNAVTYKLDALAIEGRPADIPLRLSIHRALRTRACSRQVVERARFMSIRPSFTMTP